ncbi:riboflavin kinase [Nocardiopsis coralliicola]
MKDVDRRDAADLPDDGSAAGGRSGGSAAGAAELLASGAVEDAARVLGHPARVAGTVVHGAARGRELLGFPTANLDVDDEAAVPADGVYAGWLILLGGAGGGGADGGGAGERYWPAAVSVGTNPTFDGAARTVEAYALDRDNLQLYGLRMAVVFLRRTRGQLKFDGIGELIATMAADVEQVRVLMEQEQPPAL